MKSPLLTVFALALTQWSISGAQYLQRFTVDAQTSVLDVGADAAGNVFVCGVTDSPKALAPAVRLSNASPTNTAGPRTDGFLMKFGPDGRRLGAVVFGGSDNDYASHLKVDAQGEVIISGYTESADFPTRHGFQPQLSGTVDGFVCKFAASGTNLIFSTFVGGLGADAITALALDNVGNILVGGTTWSDDFLAASNALPSAPGWSESFMARIAGDGSVLRGGRRFGGTGNDWVQSIAGDNAGNAVLTGFTYSYDFPTVNAFQPTKPTFDQVNAFITKIALDNSIVFSTFLGGDGTDWGFDVAINETGEILIAGNSTSQTLPLRDPLPIEPTIGSRPNYGFVAKLDADGSPTAGPQITTLPAHTYLSSIVWRPDGRAIAIGNAGGSPLSLGIPMVATLTPGGALRTWFDTADCDTLARPEHLGMDGAGNLIMAGFEVRRGVPGTGQFVARYTAASIDETSLPAIQILTPTPGERVPPRQPLAVSAAVVGATGEVRSVTFYDGARRLGVVTQVPFSLVWTNPGAGTHRLRAVADLGSGLVTSCVNRFTAQAPANDNFSQRIPLTGERVAVRGQTTGASSEPWENFSYSGSVWYSWTPPRDGVFEIKATSAIEADNALLSITTGSAAGNQLLLQEAFQNRPLLLSARRGTNYQIRFASYSGRAFLLTIRPVTPPANDAFAKAQVLHGSTPNITTTTRNATAEAGEPHTYIGSGSGSTWYAWTAPASGLHVARVGGVGTWPNVGIYAGQTLTNLTAVAQSISGLWNGAAWQAERGTRYYIQLLGGDTNQVTLEISPHLAPSNDDFADRRQISSGMAATGTLAGATFELIEPNTFSGSPGGTVWYRWTPPTAGVFRVSVVGFGRARSGSSQPIAQPSYGTLVSIYTGGTLDQLVTLTPYYSEPMFYAVEGEEYQIQVSGGEASFALEISRVPVLANDNFAGAILLSGGVTGAVGTTLGATLEPGEPEHGFSSYYQQLNDSVWFTWTAPSNGLYSFSASEAGSIGIYTGSSVQELTPVATHANRHTVTLTAGTSYRVAVVGARRFSLRLRPAAVPANDNFAGRQILSGLHTGSSSAFRDATAEPDEPAHAGSAAQQSLWFSWQAPTNGSFLIWSSNYSAARISVYTGTQLKGLQSIGSAFNSRGLQLSAVAGTTYQIAIEPTLYATSVSWEIRYQPPPRNNDFTNRIRLLGEQVSVVASNVGATAEAGEPRNGPSAPGHSVWWSWRVPRTGRVSFSVTSLGSYFSPSFRIYLGSAVQHLFPLSLSNYYVTEINLAVRAGDDLRISVDGTESTPTGLFRLDLHYTGSPANNAFARRAPFTGQASGTMEGASTEPGEPLRDYSPEAGSVWWQWRPAVSGVYELSLSPYVYGMGVRVFTGTRLEALLDATGSPEYPSHLIHVDVTAGTNYVIQLTGNSANKAYALRARRLMRPINDDFSRRITVSGTNISVTGSNIAATAEANEPAHAGDSANRSVWWSWTAPTEGLARIRLLNYSYARIAAYTGATLESLALVEQGSGVIAFAVQAGTTYHIAHDRPYDSTASDPFQWVLTLHPPPSNDNFANRRVVSGRTVRAAGTTLGATLEAGEPHAANAPGHSVWWRWTAPETGRYTFAVSNVYDPVALTLFTGNELAHLSILASNVHAWAWSRPILNIPVTAGTEVAISVDAAVDTTAENLTLTIQKVVPPTNDDFANRVPLTGNTARGNLEGSSREAGEPGGTEPGTSIWWTFTPMNQGWHSVFMRQVASAGTPGIPAPLPPLPPVPQVPQPWDYYFTGAEARFYSGTNLALLSGVRTLPDLIPPLSYLEPGIEYQVQVSGRDGWFGPIELQIQHVPSPPNDHFTNAITFQGEDVILSGSNNLATAEANEPRRPDANVNSVWWRWTATTDGVYSITRTNSEITAYFNVMTGSMVSDLSVVSNTIYGRGPGEYLFRATAGTTYSIAAVSSWHSEGRLQFRFARAHPPINDDFVNRTELFGTHVSLTASNHDATAEPGDPVAGWLGTQTIWWKWTSPVTDLVRLEANSAAGSIVGRVYTGDSLSNLVQVGSLPSNQPLWFQAEAGVEYAIGLTTWSTYAATIQLQLDTLSGEPAAARMLPSPPLRITSTNRHWVIETSTNLMDWTPLATNRTGQTEFRPLTNPDEPQRFFRVK